jgi:predicted kinase
MDKHLIVLCGAPGSGKTTLAREYATKDFVHVGRDIQVMNHEQIFKKAMSEEKNIIVDHMHFSKVQRAAYVSLGKEKGYKTTIILLQAPYDVCLSRCINRKTKDSPACASVAVPYFFSKYEPVEDCEADEVLRIDSNVIDSENLFLKVLTNK